MGRPLRARYANTTVASGVQEMSNTDISSLIVPLITQDLVDKVSSAGTLLYGNAVEIRTTVPAWNAVIVGGSFTDIYPASGTVGGHPTTNTSTTYTLYQNIWSADTNTSISDTGRTLQTISSGGVQRIQAMTDAEIRNDVVSNVVSSMINGGQGAYWLGTSAPVDGGTWVVRSTLVDTYSTAGGYTSTTYYLYQKTTNSGLGTTRPLKRVTGNQIQEMTNAEILQLTPYVKDYIRLTGIGTYFIGTTAPGTGTWIARGSFTDTRNVLTDDSYSGSYLGTFTGAFTGQYTGAFSGSYQGGYTGAFTGIYAGSYLSTFTGDYVGTFTGQFTGGYTRAFSGNYTGTYNASYAGSYTGSWANSFARLFTGAYTSSIYTREFSSSYTGSYAAPYTGTAYAGTYTIGFISSYLSGGAVLQTWSGTYTGPYTGGYVNPYNSATYEGTYTGGYNTGFIVSTFGGNYQGSFSTLFTGTWTGFFAGSRQNTFGGSYNQTFTGSYNNTFSKPFTGIYSRLFTGTYTGVYSQGFTGAYVGTYNQAFSGVYGNSFSRLFTGAYSGLTVSSSTVTTTYTLWVRTA